MVNRKTKLKNHYGLELNNKYKNINQIKLINF
jgi:hypothetical protein